MKIGAYECLTPFVTAGSGSACWCVAEKDGQRWFIKQFLSPVRPQTDDGTPLYRRRVARCEAFEEGKRRLYAALACVLGESLVPVSDFFLEQGHYYSVSEYIADPALCFENARDLQPHTTRELLHELALCLLRLHAQGVVHADLRPDHALMQLEGRRYRVRLIDFDSGFLEEEPPDGDAIEGDPVYLAPEAYLRMTGQSAALTRKIDVFAFGAIIHRLWTGALPRMDERYAYLYEAALDGGDIRLSPALPTAYRWLVKRMLSADPAARPDDAEIERMLAPLREDAPASPFSAMSPRWKSERERLGL